MNFQEYTANSPVAQECFRGGMPAEDGGLQIAGWYFRVRGLRG